MRALRAPNRAQRILLLWRISRDLNEAAPNGAVARFLTSGLTQTLTLTLTGTLTLTLAGALFGHCSSCGFSSSFASLGRFYGFERSPLCAGTGDDPKGHAGD